MLTQRIRSALHSRGARLWSAAAAIVAVVCLTAPTQAFASSNVPPGAASFGGRTIYLSQGWQGAQACVVRSRSDVECYATATQMRTALSAAAATMPAAASTACGGQYLYLYEGASFSGRVLALQNLGFWVNLADYGFGPQLGSWTNQTTCSAYAATGTNGSGSWLSMPRQSWSYGVGSPWSSSTQSVEIAY